LKEAFEPGDVARREKVGVIDLRGGFRFDGLLSVDGGVVRELGVKVKQAWT
jgi:hypothetical protein